MKRYGQHPVAPTEPYHTVGVACLRDRAADELVAQLSQFIPVEVVNSLPYFTRGSLRFWRDPERGERLEKIWIIKKHLAPAAP